MQNQAAELRRRYQGSEAAALAGYVAPPRSAPIGPPLGQTAVRLSGRWSAGPTDAAAGQCRQHSGTWRGDTPPSLS